MAWKCPACTSENIDGELRCVCGYELEVSPNRQRKISAKRLLLWAGAIASICGGLYCFSGYAMVASFSVAHPENIEHYRHLSKLRNPFFLDSESGFNWTANPETTGHLIRF